MAMTNRYRTKPYFLLIGVFITWFAVVLQFYLIIENRIVGIPETTVRFFSYFTILTNTLVAICFTVLYRGTKSNLYQFISRGDVLTAVCVYIFIVGLVYQVILRATWSPGGLQFIVDELLHSVIPLYFVVYWIVFVPKERLQWKSMLSWLLYPSLYLAFIMIGGAVSGFYPYPFIDVTQLGYLDVMANSALLLALFLWVSVCFVFAGKHIHKYRSSDF